MIDEELIVKIYNKFKNTMGGKNADYIPELGKVNPKLYGISIVLLDGENNPEEINVGDYDVEFAIESCSKVFTLALALEMHKLAAAVASHVATRKDVPDFFKRRSFFNKYIY